jgi:hypothetical protein
MIKIVVNRCYGGFGLSAKAMHAYAARKGLTLYPEDSSFHTIYWTVPPGDRPRRVEWSKLSQEERIAYSAAYRDARLSASDIARDDPDLVAVVEELGKAASDTYAELDVAEIPDGTSWVIEEYDGREWVAESHRTW